MVALTFPDGARREYAKGSTGLDIAKQISPSLAKRTVAMALDGVLRDLNEPIEHDGKIEFLTRDDPRALVSALALRALARDHPSRRTCASKVSASRCVICDEPAALRSSFTSYNRDFVLPPCARGGADGPAPSSRKSAHAYLHS